MRSKLQLVLVALLMTLALTAGYAAGVEKGARLAAGTASAHWALTSTQPTIALAQTQRSEEFFLLKDIALALQGIERKMECLCRDGS